MKRRIGLWGGGVALFTFLVIHYGVLPYLVSVTPYPRYGHAPDFSWVAGQIIDQHSHQSGCLYIAYNDITAPPLTNPAWVVPSGPGGSTIFNYLARTGTFVVVFGHLDRQGATGDESTRVALASSIDLAATHACYGPIYIIDHVELVPTPVDQVLIAALVGLLAGGLTARLLFLRLHRGHILAEKIEGVG
jgi:hypothetical protein